MHAKRRWRASWAIAAALCALALVSGPSLAGTPFTVSASPLTLTMGQATDVTLTVGAGSGAIACVTVSIPTGFTVLSSSVISAPGGSWTGSYSGAGPALAEFLTTNDPDRLTLGQTARFVVRVVATSALIAAWTTNAYHNYQPCSNSVGLPLLPLQPFVIIPGPTPTPTPTPTPAPTPTPTPTPKPTPTLPIPTPSLPIPTPSLPIPTPSLPIPTPSLPLPTPTLPNPRPTDSPSPSATASPSGGAVAPPPSPGGIGGSGLTVPTLPAGGSVPVVGIGPLGGFGLFAWAVPGLFLSLPGFLLVIIVGAQIGLATVFLPLARRALGGGGRRRRRQPRGARSGA